MKSISKIKKPWNFTSSLEWSRPWGAWRNKKWRNLHPSLSGRQDPNTGLAASPPWPPRCPWGCGSQWCGHESSTPHSQVSCPLQCTTQEYIFFSVWHIGVARGGPGGHAHQLFCALKGGGHPKYCWQPKIKNLGAQNFCPLPQILGWLRHCSETLSHQTKATFADAVPHCGNRTYRSVIDLEPLCKGQDKVCSARKWNRRTVAPLPTPTIFGNWSLRELSQKAKTWRRI